MPKELARSPMPKELARSPTTQTFNKDSNEKENFILESNPLNWTEDDVYEYLLKNTINSALAERCKNEVRSLFVGLKSSPFFLGFCTK